MRLQQQDFGDDTPRLQGRLNLNPISHIDPVGFIMLIVAGFGWGKPVQIDPRNFDGKYSLSKAEAIVAAAGPLMNFFLAFVFLIIYYLIYGTTNLMIYGNGINVWQIVLYYIPLINIGLGVFNLIPIPPLDGSKILMHFLSFNAKQWFYNNERYFYIALLVICLTRLSTYIISPIIIGVQSGMSWIVESLMSIF